MAVHWHPAKGKKDNEVKADSGVKKSLEQPPEAIKQTNSVL